MIVVKFTNEILSSNSYIIHSNDDTCVWLVDPGESKQLLKWVEENDKKVKGILLTHSHIDHIYGVNDICEKFDTTIYASNLAYEGLNSAKTNGSYYMGMPYIVNYDCINFVKDESEIELFKNNTSAKVISTPGHNNDCISFYVDNYLFTGDALIPNAKVHTKSKKGDKLIAIESIHKIVHTFPGKTIICPGHGEMGILSLINIPDLIINRAE
jgi:hydroxyacylglutathione hydrolase